MVSLPGRRGIVRGAVSALALAAAFGFIGCAGDNGAMPRTAVQVYTINDNLPLQSDLYNAGTDKSDSTDDFVTSDIVPVRFVGRASDPVLGPDDGAFGTVTMNSYSIDFAVNDLNGDGVDDLHDLSNMPMNTVVPVGGFASGAFLAIPSAWKIDPSGALLEAFLNGGQYTTTATITFQGEESTSHDQVTAQTSIVIMFADFVDKN